jgi:hypothetical protein
VYTVDALLHVDYRHRDESGLTSEETVENEMGRAMLPDCPPSLLSLPHAAAAAAERMTTRLFPSAVVVAGPLLAALLAHPSVFLGADLDEAPRRPVPVGRVPRGLQQTQKRKRIV